MKFLDSTGSGSTNDAVKCIDYAIAKGARIMSNSWGGGGDSQALREAIGRAEQKGILFVVAAGNDTNDNDIRTPVPAFPPATSNANILAVARDHAGARIFRSLATSGPSRGSTLRAPGGAADGNQDHDILSTLPGNKYGALAGTSMATPHVAGAAALTLSHPLYRLHGN